MLYDQRKAQAVVVVWYHRGGGCGGGILVAAELVAEYSRVVAQAAPNTDVFPGA